MYKQEIKSLDISPLASSSKSQQYIISYEGKHFEVSESVAELIKILRNSDSLSDAITLFSELRNKTYSEEDISKLMSRYIDPIFESAKKKSKSSFYFKTELISENKLNPITSLFSNLFKPFLAIPLLFMILFLELSFFIEKQYQTDIIKTDVSSLLIFGSLFFLSVIFHELGHASACKYFKTNHGHIGLGLYLHFPIFYADVSNVWKLSRRKRIIVDLAGIYFQLIFLIPLLLLYLQTGDTGIQYLIYAINLSFLFDLNPFFKFDGYWVCSDLLGIPNLRKRTIEVFTYFFNKLKGKHNERIPFLFSIGTKEKLGMLIYVILINIFFAYYLFYRIPSFLIGFLKSFPLLIQTIFENITNGILPQFNLISAAFVQLIFMTLIIYFLFRLSKSFITFVKNLS